MAPETSPAVARMVQLNARVPEHLRDRVAELAEQQDLNRDQLVRRILRAYVQQHEAREAQAAA